MRYATIDDLIDRASVDDLAERTAPENGAATGALLAEKLQGGSLAAQDAAVRGAVEMSVQRLNQALDDASAEIDSFIGRLLPLPDPPPEAIKLRCVDIALYRLLGSAEDGERGKMYDGAVAWLRMVNKGEIALTAADGADQDGNDVLLDAGKRAFDEKTMDGFLA